MKCLRCGYCCVKLNVIIVHPDYVKSRLLIHKLPDSAFIHKPFDKACPHLSFKEEEAHCRIHKYKWYNKAPCYMHGQIEISEDEVCRMGSFILKSKNERLLQSIRQAEKFECTSSSKA